jgi:hypothetical protein
MGDGDGPGLVVGPLSRGADHEAEVSARAGPPGGDVAHPQAGGPVAGAVAAAVAGAVVGIVVGAVVGDGVGGVVGVAVG